jgi:beta-1,4-mannosyl-glycoprotein beta-1,4-N-acetylglucosaminyltransferase
MIDCVLFNDEIELLKARILYLSNYVDSFVVIEANQTFSGKRKSLIAKDNQKILRELSTKPITILEADLTALGNSDAWKIERESRSLLITHVQREFPAQRVLFCDLDEFPSVEQLIRLKQCESSNETTIFSIPTPTFYRYLNLAQMDETEWKLACSFDSSHAPDVDDLRSPDYAALGGELGAHLSYLGMSADSLSSKLSSFSHTELQGFEQIEENILGLSDEYVVDHLGRFHNPSRGIMKPLSLDELPSTNKLFYSLWGKDFRNFNPPNYLSRICASAVITFIRHNNGQKSRMYVVVLERMLKRNVTCLSDLGILLVNLIFLNEILRQSRKRIRSKLSRNLKKLI